MLTIPLCLKQPDSLLFHGSAMLVCRQGNRMKRADWAGINSKDLRQRNKCRTNCVLGNQAQSSLNTPVCHFKLNIIIPYKEIWNLGNVCLWNQEFLALDSEIHLKQRHPTSIFGKYLFGRRVRSRIFGTSAVEFLASLPLFLTIGIWNPVPRIRNPQGRI